MQMNMSTGYKPEAQTTNPSKSIHKKRKLNSNAPTRIYQSSCAQSFLSRQLLHLDIDHSFQNGISNTPQANTTSLNKQEDQ